MDIEQLLINAIQKHTDRIIKFIMDKDGDEEDIIEQRNRLINEKAKLESKNGIESPIILFELYYDRLKNRLNPLTPIRLFEKALRNLLEERGTNPIYGEAVRDFCSQHHENIIDQYAELVAYRIVIEKLNMGISPKVSELFEPNEQEKPNMINDIENLIFDKKYIGYILIIFEKFSDSFESIERERWIERFVYPSNRAIVPFIVDDRCKEYNNRTILLAILNIIQKIRKSEFSYDDFVEKRFGIKGFFSNVSKNKEKQGFKDTENTCRKILNDLPFNLT